MLKDPQEGSIKIETPHANINVSIAEIGFLDKRIEAGGLDRHLRLVRLPDINQHQNLCLERKIALNSNEDNSLYICLTQEDGHQAWSSPIYLFN